jgi:hypothetical protein
MLAQVRHTGVTVPMADKLESVLAKKSKSLKNHHTL